MVFIRFILIGFITVTGAVATFAQSNRYMVFFKDKANSPYIIQEPSAFLTEKAIARRLNQNIDITELDIPVNESYVSQVRALGVSTFFKSKWFNAVLVQCDEAKITEITNLPIVDHVEYVAPGNKLVPSGGRKYFNLNKRKTNTNEVTEVQLSMLGIQYMHQSEVLGEGKTIAVLDAGFTGVNTAFPFKHLFDENKIEGVYDFVYNTSNVFQYDDHGTEVLSVISATIPDQFTGGAPQANFQLYVTEDVTSEYRIEEYNWAFAAERADSAGADIINSSLGYYDFDDTSMNYTKLQMNGVTAVSTKAAQWAAERGIVVVVSAGNEGNVAWKIITAPADAKDVIAVANVDAQGNKSGSSSIGPSADGRIKPDLAALGTGVKTVKPTGSIGSASGTSLAAPLLTSLVAGVWQRYPELTNLELIALLKKTASLSSSPNNQIGWGIPNFRAVVNYQEQVEQDELIAVYPNPVIDTIKISSKDPETISSCFIEVISSKGEILLSKTITFDWLNRVYTSDVSSLAPGLYFVRVSLDSKRYVFKVIRV